MGAMAYCPFCGVRQDVNLRHIHFRNLGTNASLPCPHCITPLDVIELDTTPALQVERCSTCFGIFFNPGELETALEAQTNPLVWLDPVQLNQISAEFGHTHEVLYLKCPMCSERMSHLNFGGQSGVILDRCGTHGVWVEGSELRRLAEWWRAGGKHIHQQNEANKAKRMLQGKQGPPRKPMVGTIESEPDVTTSTVEKGFSVAYMIGSIASIFLD